MESISDKNLYRFEKLHRVVVTGIGAVSPLGLNMEETWQALIEGKSGIGRISQEVDGERVGAINSEVDIAGQVKDFDPGKCIPQKELKRIHRCAQFSMVAAIEALTQAGLLKTPLQLIRGENPLINVNPERIGARLGTGIGGGDEIARIEDIIRDKGDKYVPAFSMLLLLAERIATAPSILLNWQAEVAITTAACASAAIATTDAFRVIQHGQADVMLAGGAESTIHRVGVSAFNNMGALSRRNDDPTGASRPFDHDPTEPDPAIVKMYQWEDEGFIRINQALADIDLIPQLNELFSLHGLKVEQYLIFDANEASSGFPVPVLTRYIFPVLDIEAESMRGVYSGIAISEILGLGGRDIKIQIGLDKDDITKIASRWDLFMQTASKNEKGDLDPKLEKPQWWQYPYPAVDLTRPYDLADEGKDSLLAEVLNNLGWNPHSMDTVYFYQGKSNRDSRLSYDIIIESEMAEGDTEVKRTPFQQLDSETRKGLEKMEDLIKQFSKS